MNPFKKEGHHIVLELLYNNKHKEGCFVLDNAFKILKNNFVKFDIHVSFVPNALIVCCLLHNLNCNLILYFISKNTNETRHYKLNLLRF